MEVKIEHPTHQQMYERAVAAYNRLRPKDMDCDSRADLDDWCFLEFYIAAYKPKEATNQEGGRVGMVTMDDYRTLSAAVYQAAGACGFPECWLGALRAASTGSPFKTDDLLPLMPEDLTPIGAKFVGDTSAAPEPPADAVTRALKTPTLAEVRTYFGDCSEEQAHQYIGFWEVIASDRRLLLPPAEPAPARDAEGAKQ